jgi:hypothetical protein
MLTFLQRPATGAILLCCRPDLWLLHVNSHHGAGRLRIPKRQPPVAGAHFEDMRIAKINRLENLHSAQRHQDPLELPLMAMIQQRPAGRWNADRAKCANEAAVEFRGWPEFWSLRVSSPRDTLRAVRSELRRIENLAGFQYPFARSPQYLQVPVHWPRVDSRRMDRPARGRWPNGRKAGFCPNHVGSPLWPVLISA